MCFAGGWVVNFLPKKTPAPTGEGDGEDSCGKSFLVSGERGLGTWARSFPARLWLLRRELHLGLAGKAGVAKKA